MGTVELDQLSKTFPDGTEALREVSLTASDGELVVFVGPSGCGKSTALRLLAGLEIPTSGRIVVDSEDVTDLDGRDRDVAMVFQDYALYPNMSVYGNLEFPLRTHRLGAKERKVRVGDIAQMLELEELVDRTPAELSGGQRQRVAMGRALIREPSLFLLDEPLSNLDAKLRVQMRSGISDLQRSLGVTTFYVTHDQTEALTMGDRVAVLNEGKLQQVSSPREIYRRPANTFVAGFVGSPPINLIGGVLDSSSSSVAVSGGKRIDLRGLVSAPQLRPDAAGSEVTIGLRPEELVIGDDDGFLRGEISRVEWLGSEAMVDVVSDVVLADTGSDEERSALTVRADPHTDYLVGDHVTIGVSPKAYLHLFLAENGKTIAVDAAEETR